MKKLMLVALLAGASTVALADSTIVTTTSTWKSVPITVDTEKQTYVVDGTVPEGDFYYTYSGYRCIKEKKDIAGVNAVVFHSSVAGGSDIYCYPEA